MTINKNKKDEPEIFKILEKENNGPKIEENEVLNTILNTPEIDNTLRQSIMEDIKSPIFIDYSLHDGKIKKNKNKNLTFLKSNFNFDENSNKESLQLSSLRMALLMQLPGIKGQDKITERQLSLIKEAAEDRLFSLEK